MQLDESYLTHGSASPFLPGTKIQYAYDSTSLGLLKTCPRLYEYTMIQGWVPKDESIHLTFGIHYHSALQYYDVVRAEGMKHEDAIHETIRVTLKSMDGWEVDRTSKTGKYKNPNTLISLVVDYLDHYEDDPAETYIKSDGTAAVELSFRFELDWGPSYLTADMMKSMRLEDYGTKQPEKDYELPIQPYLLSGHLDRVINFNDNLFVLDHKTTTTTLSDYYFNQYEPNNQMTLYSLAGHTVLDAPIKGVCISGAQIMLDSPNRFVRRFTYRTADQLDEWLLDLRFHLANAEHYATVEHWPMNDVSCDKFGGCKFRGVCSKSPQVREMFLKTDFVKLEPEQRWNPLKPR